MFRGSQIVKTGREHRHSPGFKKSLVMGELGGRHFWPVSKQVTVRARADCPGLLMPTLLCPYLDCSPSSGSHHQPLCIPRKDQSQRVSSQGQQWFSEPGLHLSCPWPLPPSTPDIIQTHPIFSWMGLIMTGSWLVTLSSALPQDIDKMWNTGADTSWGSLQLGLQIAGPIVICLVPLASTLLALHPTFQTIGHG